MRIDLPILAAAFAIALPTIARTQQPPTVTRLLTIGCDECADARQFGTILDVDVNARGDVLVADKDAPNLRLFDATGKLVWSGGRTGKGPGEYLLPIRARLLADGSIIVVDMTTARITRLAPERSVQATVAIGRIPEFITVDHDGVVTLGADNYQGGLVFSRWKSGNEMTQLGTIPFQRTAGDGFFVFPSIARRASGPLLVINSSKYEIATLDDKLASVVAIHRDIPRVRRTPAEEAEIKRREATYGKQLSAAERRQSKQAAASTPVLPSSSLSFKSHFAIDALRLDDKDRLWVRTQRGNESSTLFDVFTPQNAFLGTVTVPHSIMAWTSAHGKLVTAIENDDGIPQVVVWQVR